MKSKLRKIIIWLYWKTNCHMHEPFSKQLMLYSIPGSMTKEKSTLLAFQIKYNQEQGFMNMKMECMPIASCSFPGKDIDTYNDIDIKRFNDECRKTWGDK